MAKKKEFGLFHGPFRLFNSADVSVVGNFAGGRAVKKHSKAASIAV